MDDEEYARQLFDILTRPVDESVNQFAPGGDRIDRDGGYGTEVRVTSVHVVTGEHGAELEVGYILDLPDRPEYRDVPREGTMRVPGDAEWRSLSAYDEPLDYAWVVAHAVTLQVHRHVSAHQGRTVPYPTLPGRDEQWALLLEHVGHEGPVREVGKGRVEVTRTWDGIESVLTVVVTPDEWEQLLHRNGTGVGFGDWFGPLVATMQEDEGFLVYWRDDLHASTREELPPVRGTASERRFRAIVDEARARNPDATFRWTAHRSRRSADQGRE